MSVPAPSSRRAATVEAAVAPAPSTIAVRGAAIPLSASAAMMPSTSVLWACQPASLWTKVLAPPTPVANSVARWASSRARRLSGMVSDRPAHRLSRLVRNGASSSSVHSYNP